MDSLDPPPHLHRHPQPPHPAVLLAGPHNSYPLPYTNTNNATTTSANTMHPAFPFNSMPAPKPPDVSPSAARAGGFSIEPARKKRGRPRKYSPDNSIGLGLSSGPVSQISSLMASNDGGGGGGVTPSSETSAKRNRGRPPGSVKRQMDALGLQGVGFTPHVITVNAGEDVASKIMALSQQGPRTVCILSANGAICNVTLRQPAMSGGNVTYEGRFEIISLTGCCLLSESNGDHSQNIGLSISLAGSDGRVLGGGVAGMLKAASPVQVVVGSFIAEAKKSNPRPASTPPSHMSNFGAPGAGTIPSPGTCSESGEANDHSPLNYGSGSYGNAGQPSQTMPTYNSMGGWPNSMKVLPN